MNDNAFHVDVVGNKWHTSREKDDSPLLYTTIILSSDMSWREKNKAYKYTPNQLLIASFIDFRTL